MITSKSVQSGFSLADEFADRGLTIVPVANTPLSDLVSSTNCLTCCYGELFQNVPKNANDVIENALGTTNFVNSLSEAIEKNSTNAYKLHDGTMDQYIRVVKNAVSKHLHVAKNVVSPIVIELAEKTIESFNNDKAKELQDEFNIICVEPTPILSAAGFAEEIINKYQGRIPVLPKGRICIKADVSLTLEDIKNIVMDFYPDFQAELIDHYNGIMSDVTYTDPKLWDGLAGFICKEGCHQDVLNSASTIGMLDYNCDDVTVLNKLTSLYLLAVHMYQHPELGINHTLNDWKERVAQLRDYAGARLAQYIAKYNSIVNSKTLILRTNASKKTQYVLAPLYRDWLTNDKGSPEILYTILLNNEGMSILSTINANKLRLLETWKKYSVLRNVAHKNNSIQRFKDHIKYVFSNQMKELTDVEREYAGVNIDGYRSEVMKNLEKGLSKIKISVLDDGFEIYKVARKLVCKARFFFTSANRILGDIEEYSKSNDKIDPQEAALMATIDYVADYVAEQLTLTSAV